VIPDFEAMKQHLNGIRARYGDEAYKSAATDVARQFVQQGGEAARMAREAFGDTVDFDNLSSPTTSPMSADNPIIAAIQQQVPGIKTQAQFNAFMAGFDALRLVMDAIFQGNAAREIDGHKALVAAFDVARKSTMISEKLADTPEAAVSKAAAEFKDPPRQFVEQSLQRDLLAEVDKFKSVEDLTRWYADNRARLDQVVSQSLRNELFDTIRRKKDSISV
jgi:hypothetical protein